MERQQLANLIKQLKVPDIDYSIDYTVNGVAKSASFVVSNFSVTTVDMEQIVKSVNVSCKINAVEYLAFNLASSLFSVICRL